MCRHVGQEVRKRIIEKPLRKQKEGNEKDKNKLVKQKAKIIKNRDNQNQKANLLKRLLDKPPARAD